MMRKNGYLPSRVVNEFEDEGLNDLSRNIKNPLTIVDDGLSPTTVALGRVANGDPAHRMTGELESAFKERQDDVNNMLFSLTSLVSGISEYHTPIVEASDGTVANG